MHILLVADKTGCRNTLEQLLDFWCTLDEWALPKIELAVLDELDECDQQSPRVRPVHNKPFQQNPRDLLFDDVAFIQEQEEQRTAEAMSVRIGVPEVIGQSAQEKIPPFRVQISGKVRQDCQRGVRGHHVDTLLVCLPNLDTQVKRKRIHQGNIILAISRVPLLQQLALDVRQERLLTGAQIIVHIGFQVSPHQCRGIIRKDARSNLDLGQ
mmetsp:Transcript_7292/g.17293  ORF Transcript_7292/g.17293 Transcript_7292/m.17293 type:complete len:211 (-) Transcript_7292:305-937(-)